MLNILNLVRLDICEFLYIDCRRSNAILALLSLLFMSAFFIAICCHDTVEIAEIVYVQGWFDLYHDAVGVWVINSNCLVSGVHQWVAGLNETFCNSFKTSDWNFPILQ